MMNQILISLRKKAGITQEQLAEKIGVSRQAIANWEKGDNTLDITKCIALADLYGVSIDELAGHSELSDAQAREAVSLIGDCELVELSSNHNIHRFHPDVFIDAVNGLKY